MIEKIEKRKIRMKAIVTLVELSFDDVVSILSGFNSYSSYWVSLVDWEDEQYHEARNNVSERHDDESFPDDWVFDEYKIDQKTIGDTRFWVIRKEGK